MRSPLNYLIIHGSRGSPEGNWFPWLKEKLEAHGDKVLSPNFPTPKGQDLASWKKVADAALKDCDPANTILIGHSTGAVFVLRMAEQIQKPYRAIFSVCPFACDLGLKEFDPLNTSFVHPGFNWAKVREGVQKITCFAGENDLYVPLAASQDVAKRAGAELIIIEKGGHLNAESGYREFPLLLEKICEG